MSGTLRIGELCILSLRCCGPRFLRGRLYITSLVVRFAERDKLFFVRGNSDAALFTPHTKIRKFHFCLNLFQLHSLNRPAFPTAFDSARLWQRYSWPGARIVRRRRSETTCLRVREAVPCRCSPPQTEWVCCTPGNSPRDTIEYRLWSMTYSSCVFLKVARKPGQREKCSIK